MLIAPTQSATPMPRQINRRIYFHTIIAASKALQFTVAMRAKVTNGNGLAVFDPIRRKRNGGAAVLIAFDLIKVMSHLA